MKKIILVGRSCSGKTTLKDYMIEHHAWKPDISYTTRPIRDDETNGTDYHFVEERNFVDGIKNGKFIQHDYFNGRYYGTHVNEFLSKDVFIMTPDGITSLTQELREKCIVVYLDVPKTTLINRMIRRGDMTGGQIEKRVAADTDEFDGFEDFDVRIYNNLTLEQLSELLNMERNGNINLWYLLSEFGNEPYELKMKNLDMESGDFDVEVWKKMDGDIPGVELQSTHKFNAKNEKATMFTMFNKKWEQDVSVNIAAYMQFCGQFFAHTTNPKFEREDLLYCSAGLVEESGEIMSLIRKKNWYDKQYKREDMLEELGDAMWYLSNLIRFSEFSMSEVLEFNKHKIEKRYGAEGIFDPEKARNKDTETELATAAAKMQSNG